MAGRGESRRWSVAESRLYRSIGGVTILTAALEEWRELPEVRDDGLAIVGLALGAGLLLWVGLETLLSRRRRLPEIPRGWLDAKQPEPPRRPPGPRRSRRRAPRRG